MAVSIAEYLGQRTDSETPIVPCEVPPTTLATIPICPFNNYPCSKIMKGFKEQVDPDSANEEAGQSKHPVCSLRKNDGTYYIVCEDRLISASTSQISDYQKDMLLQVAKVLFNQDIEFQQLGYKSEVRIQTGETAKQSHRADFVLAVVDPEIITFGPRRMLIEVQGGGETNNTGSITRHINQWSKLKMPNNEFLRQTIRKAGTIETNAWRRFQEQLFAKATTAKKSGFGFAVVLGEVVFDYIVNAVPKIYTIRLQPDEDEWDTVFVVYKEQISTTAIKQGSIDLEIAADKTIYTSLAKLFPLLTDRGNISPAAFSGEFTTLSGEKVILE